MYPIAHRGEHRRHDENTLGSIRAVRRAEVDLRVTRDGRFVLMHDRVLDRTTNGTGRVIDRSWRYVRSLRTQPRGARVPTWAQVLDAARASGTRLVVEVKSYNADWRRPQLKDATRQVRRARMGDRVHFGGQTVPSVLRRLAPATKTYWRPKPHDRISAAAVRRKSAQVALVLPEKLTRSKVRDVNRGGFSVWARRGTKPRNLTRSQYWSRIERTGVQGTYTDRPFAFKRWCARH